MTKDKTKKGFKISELNGIDEVIKKRSIASELAHSELLKLTSPRTIDIITKQQNLLDSILGKTAIASIGSINNLLSTSNIESAKAMLTQHNHSAIAEKAMRDVKRYASISEQFSHLANHNKMLMTNTLGQFTANEVLQTNKRLSEAYINSTLFAKELTRRNTVQDAINKNTFNAATKMQKQMSQLYQPKALDLLQQKELTLGKLFNNKAIEAARAEVTKFQSVFDKTSLNFEKIKAQVLGSTINKSTLELAALNNRVASEIFNSSALSNMHSIESHLKVTALNALDIFQLYNDKSVIEKAAINEIKITLNQSGKKSDIQFYISMLFNVLVLLYTLHSTVQSEKSTTKKDKELQASIDNIETVMVSQFYLYSEQLTDIDSAIKEQLNDSKLTEYVVIRAVNLRTQNNTSKESHVIALLQPNQKVELLKRGKKWIYVGYFDFIEDVPKTGWVCKKYLKMIK